MKRTVLASALLISTVFTSAMAADLGRPIYKAPVIVAAPMMWNGFYIGGHGGYGWSDAGLRGTAGTANHRGDGALAGGQIGINWQFSQNWVFGLEADGSWADIAGRTSCPNAAFRCSHQIDALATFRGRLGYTFGNVMIYGTGGAAYGDVSYDARSVATGAIRGTAYNRDVWGWAAGAGIEWMFAHKWSAKVEYMHYNLGRDDLGVGAVFATGGHVRTEVDTVKVGVNYHF